ncbi:MAG: hypothetical protein ACHQIG_01580 [Acidimicrobiia bacterium]
MAPRDYEMEAAVAAVGGRVSEPIVRALVVGSPGSQDGSLKGAITSVFGRSRRTAGLHSRNVLVLTPSAIRIFSCRSRGWPPEVDGEVGTWPVGDVLVEAIADEKWSAFNASHSGSVTNRFYRIALMPRGGEPVELEVTRTDSARATIQALEDATGSAPSKITARRRKKEQRDAADAAPEPDDSSG